MAEEIKVIKSTFQALEPYSDGVLGIGIPEQIFVVGEEFELEINYNPLELAGVLKDEVSLLAKVKNDGKIYRIMIIRDKDVDNKTFKASDVLYRKVYGLEILEANASGGVNGVVKMWFKRDMPDLEPEPEPSIPDPDPGTTPGEGEEPGTGGGGDPEEPDPEQNPPYTPGEPSLPNQPEEVPVYKCCRCCKRCYHSIKRRCNYE